eukprot:TRINITY_DN2197_c0_g1_i1.p1 TRINITY_DN2197_c0_g1~~TRINITY_DN2197_c0_g1_i1.p1  ORF type:complete len:236 (-),score=48.04 TRINITY_DN2197_c0_g1_i1:215-922(-)
MSPQKRSSKDLSGPESDDFVECHPWKSNSRCSNDTVATIRLEELYPGTAAWDVCGTLSPACERFFVYESCFYECEPNTALYRRHLGDNPDNEWEMYQMPISADFAEAFYFTCHADSVCGGTEGKNIFWCDDSSTQCGLVSDIYEDAEEMINKMFGEAFVYETAEDQAYTMWFYESENPNDAITECLFDPIEDQYQPPGGEELTEEVESELSGSTPQGICAVSILSILGFYVLRNL